MKTRCLQLSVITFVKEKWKKMINKMISGAAWCLALSLPLLCRSLAQRVAMVTFTDDQVV